MGEQIQAQQIAATHSSPHDMLNQTRSGSDASSRLPAKEQEDQVHKWSVSQVDLRMILGYCFLVFVIVSGTGSVITSRNCSANRDSRSTVTP